MRGTNRLGIYLSKKHKIIIFYISQILTYMYKDTREEHHIETCYYHSCLFQMKVQNHSLLCQRSKNGQKLIRIRRASHQTVMLTTSLYLLSVALATNGTLNLKIFQILGLVCIHMNHKKIIINLRGITIRQQTTELFEVLMTKGKIEKVPRDIQVKSRVKTWQARGIWSQQLEQKHVTKRGTEPGVRKGKRSLLASHTRCKCSMETTHDLVKVKRK